MGEPVHVDLTELARDLKDVDKKFATAVRKNIRTAVAASGADLLAVVKSAASWSTRIPAATSITTSFSTRAAGIALKVNRRKASHARAYEMGNKNTFSEDVVNAHGGFKTVNGRRVARNRLVYGYMRKTGKGMGRGLRHPVFNKGGYAEEATRPFFFTSIEARTPGVEKAFQAAVDLTARDAGFK
jgi:hypothetical protein